MSEERCPECAFSERVWRFCTHALGVSCVVGMVWQLAHGIWKDALVGWGAIFLAIYACGAVAWFVRRRRSRRSVT